MHFYKGKKSKMYPQKLSICAVLTTKIIIAGKTYRVILTKSKWKYLWNKLL